MLTTALLKRAEEPGDKYAIILALAVGRSASTWDQGVSKAFYIFSDIMGVCTMDESGFSDADEGSLDEGRRAWLQVRRHPGAGRGQIGLHLGPRRVEGVLRLLGSCCLGQFRMCLGDALQKMRKKDPVLGITRLGLMPCAPNISTWQILRLSPPQLYSWMLKSTRQ